MIRDDQKLQVQQAIDLVALIGEHVALRPRGKEFLGLCPFHDDKNPSMHVSPAKQIYKCFSCGAGGDVFSFMMNYHKMTFPEALRHLADRAGIKLVEHRRSSSGAEGQEGQGVSDRERMVKANDLAVGFYRALLRHAEHGKIARDYIESRRISPEMVEAFQIGYAPDRWDGLALTIQQKGWDLRAFEMAGLVSARSEGNGHYDRLRHRLIFPICDSLGRPIAFGGRKLRDEDEPKYLNSPETPLFNKSATLFGLHLAKKAIIDTGVAIIVEGYTDVIACHQAGVKNVVATLGTALTSQHAAQLRRYAQKVVLIFDADEAGQKAADRAVEVFLTEELDVCVAVLPDELDPAELFEQADGLERWNRCVGEATDALAYQLDRLRDRFDAADTITGRQKLAEDYLRQIAALGLHRAGAVRKALVLARLAELLHMPEAAVDAIVRRVAAPPRPAAPPVPDNFDSDDAGHRDNPDLDVASGVSASRMKALQLAESEVIGCLLLAPDLFHCTVADGRTLDEAVTPGEMVTPRARQLYACLHDRLAESTEISLAGLLADLASSHQTDLGALATDCLARVEAATDGEPELLKNKLSAAAACLVAFHREREYLQFKQQVVAATAGDTEAPAGDRIRLTGQLLEHLRNNPSPVRIARVRNG